MRYSSSSCHWRIKVPAGIWRTFRVACKAPGDWRSPRRFAYFRNHCAARSVLECPPSAVLLRRTGGGPPPLFPEAYQTVPRLIGIAIPFLFRCSGLSRTPKLNFCVNGVRPPARDTDFVACSRKRSLSESRPQLSGMDGRLGNVPWLELSQSLRPGTGALRPGLVRPAITGNFGVRVYVTFERRCVSFVFSVYQNERKVRAERRTGPAVAPSSFLASTIATDGVENFVGKKPTPRRKNQAGREDRPGCKGKI